MKKIRKTSSPPLCSLLHSSVFLLHIDKNNDNLLFFSPSPITAGNTRKLSLSAGHQIRHLPKSSAMELHDTHEPAENHQTPAKPRDLHPFDAQTSPPSIQFIVSINSKEATSKPQLNPSSSESIGEHHLILSSPRLFCNYQYTLTTVICHTPSPLISPPLPYINNQEPPHRQSTDHIISPKPLFIQPIVTKAGFNQQYRSYTTSPISTSKHWNIEEFLLNFPTVVAKVVCTRSTPRPPI